MQTLKFSSLREAKKFIKSQYHELNFDMKSFLQKKKKKIEQFAGKLFMLFHLPPAGLACGTFQFIHTQDSPTYTYLKTVSCLYSAVFRRKTSTRVGKWKHKDVLAWGKLTLHQYTGSN